MKKLIWIAAAILAVTGLLTSCGGGSGSNSSDSTAYYYGDSGAGGESAQSAPAEAYIEAEEDMAVGDEFIADDVQPSSGAADTGDLAEKIIYYANADIETIDFDASIDGVYDMMERCGAFIENSYIGRSSYREDILGVSGRSFRTADFTLRVPKENFQTMLDSLADLGNVTSLRSSAENITAQYRDTESRLAAYRTEEARLLEILESAASVEDMLVIEARLSEIRYETESLTSSLKKWQNQVDYSNVGLYINEVDNLSEQIGAGNGYWGTTAEGFRATLNGVALFFKTALQALIVFAPVIIILVALLAAALFLRKKLRLNRAVRRGPREPGGKTPAASAETPAKGDED